MEARHSGILVSEVISPDLSRVFFLSEHSFKVRVGTILSELHEQEMGVPQGSILFPALFSIKINNIVKSVLNGTDCSLFVDDFASCVSGKTINRVETAMQLCVNSVQEWESENGFKFSTSKTVCIHFHQQYVFPQTLTSCWEKRL